MILTIEGRVIVAVGEVISYKGRVCECVNDAGLKAGEACEKCVFCCHDMACVTLECRSEVRPDGLGVFYRPFGEKEGGEE